MNRDENYIRRCIELSVESLRKGDQPFGSLITRNGEVVCQTSNDSSSKRYLHAEILALDMASTMLRTNDLSDCTLYSNYEPCSMCSFMIREYKIGKVVFAARSPDMGGFSRWNILEDDGLTRLEPYFGKPPQIVPGVLENEAVKVFREAGWKILEGANG